jgi:hypothetical protein
MAEILLRAQNQIDIPSDPEKAARLRVPGDVVVVMPDGHSWGSREGLPRFWIIKVPGLSVETVKKLTDALYVDTGTVDGAGNPILRMVNKSRYTLPIARLKKPQRDTLAGTGVLTVNLSDAQAAFIDKVTGTVTL